MKKYLEREIENYLDAEVMYQIIRNVNTIRILQNNVNVSTCILEDYLIFLYFGMYIIYSMRAIISYAN